MSQVYPWNESLFQDLAARYQRQQLAHAILLSGMAGLGKAELANSVAAMMLCHQPQPETHQACGECKSCQLIAAQSHPDLLLLAPEKPGSGILIEQIRQLNQFSRLKSQLGGVQVIILQQANLMNRNAANALLKTLEEPSENVYLLLLVNTVQGLLPTIRSRCQHYRLNAPDRELQRQWLRLHGVQDTQASLDCALNLAHGAPALAQVYLQEGLPERHEQQLNQFLGIAAAKLSATEVAEAWIRYDAAAGASALQQSLHWMHGWVMDLIRVKLNQAPADRYSEQLAQLLGKLASNLEINALFDYYDKLMEGLRLAGTQVNQQLMLEQLLINWNKLCNASRVVALA